MSVNLCHMILPNRKCAVAIFFVFIAALNSLAQDENLDPGTATECESTAITRAMNAPRGALTFRRSPEDASFCVAKFVRCW